MADTTSMSCEVAVIGEIFMDHVFSGFTHWPSPGSEIFTDEYTPELGGGAVATACALARLGHSVRLIGVVGKGEFDMVQRRLTGFGVDSDLLARSEDRTGISVSISTAQDRSFFTYRGANRELPDLLGKDSLLVKWAAKAKHVHLALPLSLTDGPGIVRALKAHQATISLDVGHHPEWLASADNVDVLREVDYFLPNEREAELLTGDAETYLAFCRETGLAHGVLKLGAKGAAMLSGDRIYRATACAVDVVDTTGAGDAFDAGLIDGVLSGVSETACLRRACACGTLSTSAAGALGGLPTRGELDRFVETHYAA